MEWDLASMAGSCSRSQLAAAFATIFRRLPRDMGLAIADLGISVSIDFEGKPSRATAARMTVDCLLADGSDPTELIERAKAITTIGNSIRHGVPVAISRN